MVLSEKILKWLPAAAGLLCGVVFVAWLSLDAPHREAPREPVKWNRTGAARQGQANQPADVTTPGPGAPSALPGSWPQFRGAGRDNIAVSQQPIARAWPAGGPKVLWRVAVGEGHAGAAIHRGRVYLIDYDRDHKQDAIRCLSLDDGREIWRTTYPVEIKRNHGMSRTVPAVTDKYVVTLGPKCHVYCCDADTGKVVWKMNLKEAFGATEPPWYAGQCPLIDGDRVILAPGGTPLMMAVELATGKIVWQTRSEEGLGMTHSSIQPMELGGRKQYVYCANKGVAGIAAEDGRVLWTWPDWRIKIANVPSPVPVGDGRIFFSGGYNAGCAMARLTEADGALKPEQLFRLKATEFGSDQQTPILYQDHLYGVIPSGDVACLTLDGKRLWTSGGDRRFGLGPYLMTADGRMLALNDETGELHMAEVSPAGYKELGRAKLLNGHDAWGPLAFAEGRLILRDLTEMICVDLGQ